MNLQGATATQYSEREGLIALLNSGHIPRMDVAIDGGAHVGAWSEIMARHFAKVLAFEPGPAFSHLEQNAAAWPNVDIHRAALTDNPVMMESWHRKANGKMTSRRVRNNPRGDVPGVTIDRLKLEELSLLKLDVEGYEYPALIGARKTIARCQPFILVELAGHGKHAGHTDSDVRVLLWRYGYRKVWHYGVDHGFAPRGNI